MKNLILTLFLILISCKDSEKLNTQVKTEFHIKVVPCSEPSPYWAIHFTNDNWATFEDIEKKLESFDITSYMFEKEEAIKLAKTLDTYEKCLKFNEINQDLIEKREEILIY